VQIQKFDQQYAELNQALQKLTACYDYTNYHLLAGVLEGIIVSQVYRPDSIDPINNLIESVKIATKSGAEQINHSKTTIIV